MVTRPVARAEASLATAANEIIEDDDFGCAALQGLIGDMGADETGAAGDQNPLILHVVHVVHIAPDLPSATAGISTCL